MSHRRGLISRDRTVRVGSCSESSDDEVRGGIARGCSLGLAATVARASGDPGSVTDEKRSRLAARMEDAARNVRK